MIQCVGAALMLAVRTTVCVANLQPINDDRGNAVTFRIIAPDGSLHFCGVDVSPSAAGTIQTEDVRVVANGGYLHSASLTPLTAMTSSIPNPASARVATLTASLCTRAITKSSRAT